MNGMSTVSIFKTKDGKIYGCGQNDKGQLGIQNTNDDNCIYSITLLPINGNKVKKICVGWDTVVFLMEDGTVKGCGNNSSYQLSDEKDIEPNTIIDLGIIGVKDIVCGQGCMFFMMKDGSVMARGSNTDGQLGLDIKDSFSRLTTIDSLGKNNVRKIVSGYNNTYFIMKDGTVKGCGNNENYTLCQPTDTNIIKTPIDIPIDGNEVEDIKVTSTTVYFLMKDGTIKGCGSNESGQLGYSPEQYVRISTLIDLDISSVKAINVYLRGLVCLLNDGTVKGCGNNAQKELGLENAFYTVLMNIPFDKKVVDIYSGNNFNLFLLEDGSIKGCGCASYGSLAVEPDDTGTIATPLVQTPIDIPVENISPWHREAILYNDITISKFYSMRQYNRGGM